MKLGFCVLILFFLLKSNLVAHCHHAHHHEENEEGFHWSKEKTEFAGIKVAVAGPGTIQDYIHVTGKVSLHPDHIAYVFPKVRGTVYEVRQNRGDRIEKNGVMAIIESHELAEMKARYLAALKRSMLATSLLEQERALQGISPLQDYLKAEMGADEAALDVRLALQNLYSLGLTDNEIVALEDESPDRQRFLEIKAPIKGTILQRNISLGESIDTSLKAFTIANFDKLLVELNVPPNDIHFVKEGMTVDISSQKDKKAAAKIAKLFPLIDEETRTVTAVALVENGSETWSPGEFVTAQIKSEFSNASVVVPLAAIQLIKGEPYIFVEEGEAFTPRVVKLGKKDREHVEIISGLAVGDSYAAHNTFCLKAEHEKEEAEHSH